MTAANRYQASCPHCRFSFGYERYHAGFGNQGYMYCSDDETVLTWDAYSPRYAALTSHFPWVLDPEEQQRVEGAVRRCPCGGRFAFVNPPRCPSCHEGVAFLVPANREYFILSGRRVDADGDEMWVAP